MDSDRYAFSIKNRVSELEKLPGLVEAFCNSRSLPRELAFKMTLVLDEFISNAINYGYKHEESSEIRVELGFKDMEITIRIEDSGEPFDPRQAPSPETHLSLAKRKRQIGGMGIHLVKNMMDNISYERKNNKNILTLSKRMDDCMLHVERGDNQEDQGK